jgi:hypothetical protein
MTRQQVIGLVAGALVLLFLWHALRPEEAPDPNEESGFDRVIFVFCDDHGHYSPGVYWHGATGGGPACLEEVKTAAPHMRFGDPDCSAAAFCGYSFQQLGLDVATGGGVALRDSPKPGADGAVDWQTYCGWNVDVILINVDRATAECHVSPDDPKAPRKRLVRQLTDLQLGGTRPGRQTAASRTGPASR